MSGAVIEYYFAPHSPWTFLGHERFVALAQRHAAEVALRPVDLGRVFAASGGQPLAARPLARQRYRLTELARFGRHLGVPINLQPRHFPVDGRPATLLILAVQDVMGTAAALELVAGLGRAVWIEERDIADPASLAAIARERLAVAPDPLVARAAAQDVAARLETNTDEAIAAGVFGAPTWRLGGELYWGQDRLEFLERDLAAHG